MSTIKNLEDSQDAMIVHFQNPQWVEFGSLVGWESNDRNMPDDADKLVDQWDLMPLAESIDEVGIVYGPIVRTTESGQYEIAAGFRRLAAMHHILGLGYLPVVVQNMDDAELLHVRAAENGPRAELRVMELANALRTRVGKGKSGHALNPDKVFRAFGLEADKAKLVMDLTNLIPEFQAKVVGKWERGSSEKQFTLEHARTMLGKHRSNKTNQRLCLEVWEARKSQPSIHAWRVICDDPQAELDKILNGGDTVTLNGPDTITGAQLDRATALPLILPDKAKLTTVLDASIAHYTEMQADLMASVDGEQVAEVMSLFGETVQQLLEAMRAQATAEALTNLYNHAVSEKWLKLSGGESLMTNGTQATAGANRIVETVEGE